MSTTEPMTTSPITIPFGEGPTGLLKLAVGACRVFIKGTDQTAWVAGTYDDPSGTLPHKISREGDSVLLTQAVSLVETTYRFVTPPTFDLTLGKAKSYALKVETGASEVRLDLGSLPLTSLELNHGAGKADINFSAPNPGTMSLIQVGSGAGETIFHNLANANATEIKIEGGAASYKLDFGGTLQQNTHAKIEAALASIELSVPQNTAARIFVNAIMGGLEIGDGLTKQGGAFLTPAALAGGTPTLTIEAQVTFGSLNVRLVS